MFKYENFKQILDETTNLIEEKKKCKDEDDIEEIQMRIDSNIQALRMIASKIDDKELQDMFIKSIESLSGTKMRLTEIETVKQRKKVDNRIAVVDDELLKNATHLKNLAVDFSASLKEDRKAMDKLNSRMNTNASQSAHGMKTLSKEPSFVSTSMIMSLVFMIFITLYLIIRFF